MWYPGYEHQVSPMMHCGCNQVRPVYGFERRCKCRRMHYSGNMFVLIVVLFILLIIVGANFKY